MTKFLEDEKYYMNTITGSVQTAEEWEDDFADYLKTRMDEVFEDWAGREHNDESYLTKVRKTTTEEEKEECGEWIEVE